MDIKTAIEVLEYHQEWRLGKRDQMIHEPKVLTEALDILLSEVKKSLIPENAKLLNFLNFLEETEALVHTENWQLKTYVSNYLNNK